MDEWMEWQCTFIQVSYGGTGRKLIPREVFFYIQLDSKLKIYLCGETTNPLEN